MIQTRRRQRGGPTDQNWIHFYANSDKESMPKPGPSREAGRQGMYIYIYIYIQIQIQREKNIQKQPGAARTSQEQPGKQAGRQAGKAGKAGRP